MADDEKKGDGPNRIMVYLRIRSAKKDEINPAEGNNYLMDLQPDQKTVLLEGGKTYNFDHVYNGGDAHNHDIYKKVGRPVIENIFKGFWGTLMVYGQTGTGKSYTMCNFDKGNEGIIPGAMKDIFERIDNEPDRVYTVSFSFIQIYLDKLQDLFNATAKEELKINRDNKGVTFPGITERHCRSYEEFLEQYHDGNQYRVITATKMNPESSRGHAALFIQVRSVPRDDPSGEVRSGKLFMIDLAGYERFSKTGVQEGLMKEEAKTINASLLSLGNVVASLAEKSEHIPWRNAKLTRMLEDAIGGKAKCSIILTAGPSTEHMHETVGTLYFGSRAMSVKTSAKASISVDYKKLAAKLQELLNAAENKISTLELEAQKRVLEREEAEANLQGEWAIMKARHEDAIKSMIESGASPEKVQEMLAANRLEQELLEETQYTQRASLEERHEKEIQEQNQRQKQMATDAVESEHSGMSAEVNRLQRELMRTKDELEKSKIKAKEADSEARRLLSDLNAAKVALTKNGIEMSALDDDDDLLGGIVPASPVANAAANKTLLANPEMRREMDRRIASVQTMLEETHMLKLQEVKEPLEEEIAHYRSLYEELKATVDENLQAQKDALTAMYEQEIEEVKRNANDVQEKLKKNHMTIKQSYQKQKEALSEENDTLTRQLAELQAREGGAGSPTTNGGANVASRPGVPSLAEVMIMKKQTERKVEEMQQVINDLKADLDYVNTEKFALERQLKEYDPASTTTGAAGEDRMKPAAVRKLKEDYEALKDEKDRIEKELFKLRAEQALSGPQRVADNEDDDEKTDGDLDAKEDMFGDSEGMQIFAEKMLRFPYFSGKEKVNSQHEHVLGTLTTDLDEYRRTMRVRLMVLGPQGCGKSSVIKCMTAQSVPLMRNVPEVQTTVHPQIQSGHVEDANTNKTEWHSLYVKFEDVAQATMEQSRSGIFGRFVGGATTDPARIHIDVVDFPGSQRFWRGLPPQFLPGKNVCYTLVYNLNQPLDAIRDDIARQLRIVHGAAHRAHGRQLGGDTPRIAVCLVGTHRDALRESKEATVSALLNKVVMSLGDCFFNLRGEETYGMVIIGNFAVSCRDWTVVGGKGPKAPTTFKDLFSFIATTTNRLNDTRPSAMLPSSKDSTSHTTYMLQRGGDDGQLDATTERTSQLNETERRLRKGIVTLLTVLSREVKVRWIMSDKDLRQLIADHIGVKVDTKGAINAINFICRELIARGIIVMLPHFMYEAKYLPKHKDDCPPDSTPLSRDCIVCLDPLRLLILYSAFIAPQHYLGMPKDANVKDKSVAFQFDVTQLDKLESTWKSGIVQQSVVQLTMQRFVPLTASDPKLMLELLSVLGCGFVLRQEAAVISPAFFSSPMAPGFIDYISFLISCHGDGVARKYKLNTIPSAFFVRLQALLIPFSHAPAKEAALLEQNWTDGSYLVFDKSRLKYGIFGSRVLKDAVISCPLPTRGVLKVEGDHLYVAVTARGPNTNAMMAAVKPILNAIHHHITTLCRREFRGVNASLQEMIIAGAESKRSKLQVGMATILERLGATPDEIAVQQGAIGQLSDPKGNEIDAALGALPTAIKVEVE
jgi:GTPase SAR1 family protein